MGTSEKATAVRAFLDALGIPSTRQDFALPYLTGEKPIPTATEDALATAAKDAADAKTITLTAAAKVGGVSRTTIWRLTRDGSLPVITIRGRHRVRLADVIKLFAGKEA